MNTSQEAKHLDALKNASISVDIHTVNGGMMSGVIAAHDDVAILLRYNGESIAMLYKRNVVSVIARTVSVPGKEDVEND